MDFYTEKEVKGILKKHGLSWKVFSDWMVGQTAPIENGELCFYKYDVDRFIRYEGNPDNEPSSEWD